MKMTARERGYREGVLAAAELAASLFAKREGWTDSQREAVAGYISIHTLLHDALTGYAAHELESGDTA